MCLLILQKEEAKIKEKHLKNAYDNNSDGVGYSCIIGKKIVTKKFRKYKKFLTNYNYDINSYGSKSPFLLHFRLATHGTNKGTTNVHPFKVREGLMFAHNGIISDVDKDKELSDTQVFNRDILQNLPKSFLIETALIKLIEGFIGTSKLAFLNADGSYKILNEDLGSWDGGVWYSNNSYEASKVYYGGYNTYGHYSSPGYYKKLTEAKEESRAYKSSYKPTLKCEWCGDKVNGLTNIDVSDKYVEDKESFLWMCDVCVDYEEEFDELEKQEIASYNDAFSLGGTA